MQKDARIALGVILILMVIVVLIWGRTPRPENQARKGPEKSPAAKSDEPKGPAKPDGSGAPAPERPVNLPAQARVTATRPPSMFPEQATQPAKATFTYSNPPAADAGTPPDDGHTASQPPETDAGTPGPAEDTHTPGAERETDTGPAPAPAPLATHIVQKGDTYQSVSRKHYDTVKMWRIIYEANRIPADSLHVGHKLIIPAAPGHPAPTPKAPDKAPGPPAPPAPQRTHTVQKGETYQSLSRQYYGTNTKWRLIYNANKIPAEALHIGHKLAIPPLPSTVQPKPTPAAAPAKATARKDTTTSPERTYTVRKGDTFISIARAAYRNADFWKRLYRYNRRRLPQLTSPDKLPVGTVLSIPELASTR